MLWPLPCNRTLFLEVFFLNYISFDRKSADPAEVQNNKSKQDGIPMWPGAQRPSALPLHQTLRAVFIPGVEEDTAQSCLCHVHRHTVGKEATPIPHPLGQVSWCHLLSLTTLYKANWETGPPAQCDSISTAKEGKGNSRELSSSVLVIFCVGRKNNL